MPSFIELYESNKEDIKKLIEALSKDTRPDRNQGEYIEEYKGERKRRTKSVGLRPDKTIPTYTYDSNKEEYKQTGSKQITVAKLSFPFPKIITRTAAHFIAGGKMSIFSNNQSEAFETFKNVWTRDMKMQSVIKKLVRTCMKETKAAVVFYPAPTIREGKEALRLRVLHLDNDSGEFFPHFDDFGDMDAFTYKFQALNTEGKKVDKAIIYTVDGIYHYVNDGGWIERPENPKEENLFGKIPVIYIEQDEPEWESIVDLLDDFETRISRLADTNDYFAEPLLKIWGSISKMPNKEDVGKSIEFDMKEDASGKVTHGDAEYATWDHTPESIKLEMETVKEAIYSMTSTPDLSFNNLKGIGTLSGIALELMFMGAFIKKEENMEIFDPAIRRCVSVVAAGLENITHIAEVKKELLLDEIDVEFTDVLPSDMQDLINTLSIASGAKPIISQQTASEINPLVKDSKTEFEKIQSEEKSFNESFKM